jgi:hypothetical protein
MQNLTHSQFINILNAHAGAAIVGIEALTDAKALKTGNPFPERTVLKHIRAVGFVGADYGAAVRREGERQGADASAFKAKPLPWGAWMEGMEGKVITHKGAHYLRTQTTPGQRQRQAARLMGYRDTQGRFLAHADVKPFLPAPTVSKRQADAGLGDSASEQIMVRTYAFASIRKVRVNGKTFALVPDAQG